MLILKLFLEARGLGRRVLGLSQVLEVVENFSGGLGF